jgi:hypothetical protein
VVKRVEEKSAFDIDIPERKSDLMQVNRDEVTAKTVKHPKLGTDCNECIFRESKEVPCSLNKLGKFLERGAVSVEEDDKFLLDRVCNFRRTEKWKSEKDSRQSSMEECVKDVKNEVNISGTLVVYADDINELKECFKELANCKYVNHFNIIVAHFENLSSNLVNDFLQSQSYFSNLVGIKGVSIKDGDINFLDEAFKRVTNGYIVTIDSSKKINTDFLEKLQKYIYEEMYRVIYVEPSDGIHEFVSFAILYKYLKGNKFWTFKEKVIQFSKEQGLESQITTWEEINERIN